ncbi:hypothetical protein E4Z66_18420 [Aliishimia ponticola]|uniref:Uncharacterized protein n=1 Tax=Aliishimia ponticola TaxID=2499833 RepID=A0A4S4N5P0_9RHOB|nr:hypothetical protein [Aliishimia ponticola]THH34412.1 hypothetical protein E4Z66_18420 [Aliishimia ponticola]
MRADANLIKYRNVTTPRLRIFVALVVIPFAVILAMVLISGFGLFGSDAFDLVVPILQGDYTRFGDFIGYLVLLLLCVGLPCAFIYVSIKKGILAPDVVVTFDPSRRIVAIHCDRPWRGARLSEYSFGDVEAIELTKSALTVSEQNEISLHMRGAKRPLVLAAIFDAQAAAQEFRKLKELGLPTRS